MFIGGSHQVSIQAHDCKALVGFSAPAPAYISAQFTLTESEARAMAAALTQVADQLAQQAIDNARLAGIAEQTKEAEERAAARVDRMNRSKTFHGASVKAQIAGLRA